MECWGRKGRGNLLRRRDGFRGRMGSTHGIKEGDTVQRTGNIASILAGEGLLGRVVNTLGEPIDGKGEIKGELFEMPLERKAPGVIFRQPVNEPLQTGIKAIDAMIPIGRGQRELIIGDRQTGKTEIAIDTIISQRSNFLAGDPIYCIYVGIGQKGSTIAGIVKTFEEYGAMDYTIVVSATASDPAAMQFYAPYAGVAIAEYFRDMGYKVALMADSTSRWAEAMREISGRLEEMPGEEGYPAYLGSRTAAFYERAGKVQCLGKNGREGSLTVIGAVSPLREELLVTVQNGMQRYHLLQANECLRAKIS